MEIGIIGAGYMGTLLAGYLTKLGHQVMISNSRGPETLSHIADKTGAKPVKSNQAAKAKHLIILSIPEFAVPKLPIEIISESKAVIIDTGNYYPCRDGQIKDIDEGLTDTEWVSKVLGREVTKAFNNIVSQSFADKASLAGDKNRIALPVAGNNELHKKIVMDLVEDIGFDAIDGGALSDSWKQQPGEAAYCQDLDVGSLKTALQQADYTQHAVNFEKANKFAQSIVDAELKKNQNFKLHNH